MPSGPGPVDRHGSAGLVPSFGQERLWLLERLRPGNPAYLVPAALRMEGDLAAAAMASALAAVVARHEVLRSGLRETESGLRQVEVPGARPSFAVCDLSGLAGTRREAEAERLRAEEETRAFDLTTPPLLRAVAVRRDRRDHLLLVTLHHAVSDGWSLGILVRELRELYDARVEGRPPALPALPIQYADFAAWQRERMEGPEGERLLAYWRERLAGVPPVLELPTDRTRAAVRSGGGDAVEAVLPAAMVRNLEALCGRTRTTPFMALLAAFQAFLGRLAAVDDLAVGVPAAGRGRDELAGLIGFFVDTVVVRADLSGGPSFEEHLTAVRERVLGDLEHQAMPFERLVAELAPERSSSHAPLVQVFFALQDRPASDLGMAGLAVERLPERVRGAKFDLSLVVTEGGPGEWTVSLGYATDLIDATTARRWLGGYLRLVGAALDRPGTRLDRLPVDSRAERHAGVVEWSAAPSAPGIGEAVHLRVARQAAARPDAVAITGEDGTLTFGGLAARAEEVRRRIAGRAGAGRDLVVGLLTGRGVHQVVAALATLRAGGAYLPLDPSLPAERLRFMIEDAGVAVLVCDQAGAAALPAEEDGALRVPRVSISPGAPPAGGGDGSQTPETRSDERSLAYVIYTSGSTGRPKGVALSHGGLSNLVSWHLSTYGTGPETRGARTAGPGFDAAVWETWPYLAAGASLHLPPDDVRRSAAGLVRWLTAERITASFVTTPLAELCLAEAWTPPVALAEMLTGGDRLRRPPGEEHPFRLINHYGPTEGTVVATAGDVPPGGPLPPPIGRPIAGARTLVLGADGAPAPIGVPGELLLGGEGLARGYVGRPALTAERFVPDPFAATPGARLYRTGDRVALLRDGRIAFVGRFDDQVQVRGFRVEPGEIEALLESRPGVAEAVVIAHGGEGAGRFLAAYVARKEEPGDGTPADGPSLRRFLEEELPGYMVPRSFVFLDAIPRTPNGKVDRAALRPPDLAAEDDVAPRGPLEELLAGLWSEILGAPVPGVQRDFFDLGGNSLLATQLLSRVRRTLGRELPLRAFFESPTVAGVARRLEELEDDGPETRISAPIEPVPPEEREDEPPLSFAQQRLWFLDQLDPDSPLYNIPYAARITGALDLRALVRSLDGIVRRHDTLRTTFPARGGRPSQRIRPASSAGRVPVPVVDLSGLPAGRREAAARAQARSDARQPFDLAEGPLLRARLYRVGEAEHQLLLDMHHIVSDGWSMGIAIEELGALYAAQLEGRTSPLAPLPVQYVDYARWQRRWLSGEVLEEQLGYWRDQLAGCPALELTTDRPRPAVETFRGRRIPVRLDAATTREVERLARTEGATPFMVLLAIFDTLLAHHSGRTDLSVGSPIANRHREEIERLIGFFANTVVLRSRPEPERTFRDLLIETRGVTLGAHAHQDLPFEALVDELAPERDMSRNPLFQVMFIFQNAPMEQLSLPGLELEGWVPDGGTSKFDLLLFFWREGDRLEGSLEYSTELFDRTTVERFFRQYRTLTAEVLADPGRRLADLAPLSPAERHQLRVEWNDTRRALRPPEPVHRWIDARVAEASDAVALVAGEATLTYGELDRRARRLAAILRRRGVGPDVLVGVCLDRTWEMVVALLGVLRAGGGAVALDPTYPQDRLEMVMEDSGMPVLLTQSDLAERLPREGLDTVLLDRDWAEHEDRGEPVPPEPWLGLDHPIYAIYTSGSTGRPKGIVVVHRAFANLLAWQLDGSRLARRARTVQFATFGFCVSFQEILSTLCAGETLVLVPETMRRDMERLADFLDRHAVERLHVPFAALKQLADVAEAGKRPPAALREVITAGEQLQIGRSIRGLFDSLGACVLHNQYGASETHVISDWRLEGPSGAWPEIGPVGRPVANVDLHLVDRDLRPVPLGVPGEVLAGGECLPRGYLNDPAVTAGKLVPDPTGAVSGARLYRTGDLARLLPGGSIEYMGRIDAQVKIRGFRVELGEVESLLRRAPGVRDGAVVAHVGATGLAQLVAYPVAGGERLDLDLDLDAVRSFLAEKLPEYMVPTVFVPVDALPLNANGKLDREALPRPDVHQGGSDAPFVAPQGPVERALADVWADLLETERVGVLDNFFQIGGHSLLATQLISRVRTTFRIEALPLRLVFESPTVERMARALQEREPAPGHARRVAEVYLAVRELSADEVRSRLATESAGGIAT